MNRDELIKMTEAFVRQRMTGYDSGHDWWHIYRVRKLALFINEQETIADPFTLEVAALCMIRLIQSSQEMNLNRVI